MEAKTPPSVLREPFAITGESVNSDRVVTTFVELEMVVTKTRWPDIDRESQHNA